jgi:mannose-6-phosphate isomerase class I
MAQKNIPSLLTFAPTIRNYAWGRRTLLPLAGPDAGESNNPIAEVWALTTRLKMVFSPTARWQN